MTGLRRFRSIIGVVLFSSLLFVASFFKVSFIIGSKMAFFSGFEIISPLSGAFGGLSLVFPLFFIRYLFNHVGPLTFFLRHIPGLCGAWYWGSRSPVVRLVVPLGCMILFWAHPIGSQAYAYPLFWLVPILFFMRNTQGIFAQALGGTFVVHAVGSVLWLYTVPMTAVQWWSLMPVVLVERLVFAGIQTGVFQLYQQGIMLWNKYSLHQGIRKQLSRTARS